MKQFTMSMFLTKQDLYKAKAEYWMKQFEFLAERHWVQDEAEFRFNLPEDDDGGYIEALTDAIDDRLRQIRDNNCTSRGDGV